MYGIAYRYQRWIWWWWWIGFAGTAAYAYLLWHYRQTLLHRPWWTILLLAVLTYAVTRLVYYLPALFFSGLFFVWFRYLALYASRIAGASKRWLLSGWRPDAYLLALVAVITSVIEWQALKTAAVAAQKPGTPALPLHLWQLLSWTLLFKIIALLLVVRIVYWGFKTRSRFVIQPFTGYVSGTELKTNVEGLATLLASELAERAELSKRITELPRDDSAGIDSTISGQDTAGRKQSSEDRRPATLREELGAATLQPPDVGSIFQGLVSGESKIGVGFVQIPISFLLGTFGRIVQGPTISGSLYRDSGGMTLIATLTGGGEHKTWCVRSSELEGPFKSEDQALQKMVEQMSYQIFAYMADIGSTNWRAVRSHLNGLRYYLRRSPTQPGGTPNLKLAEREFIKALAEDNQFAQNHYNLGVIYQHNDLDIPATSSFREVIRHSPGFVPAYYALATLTDDDSERTALCEQVLALQPSHIEAWLLLSGPIRPLPPRKSEQRLRIVQLRAIATALSWRALCASEIAGRGGSTERALVDRCLIRLSMARQQAAESSRPTLTILHQALHVNRTSLQARFRLAMVLEDAGQFQHAFVEYLGLIRDRYPSSPQRRAAAIHMAHSLNERYRDASLSDEERKVLQESARQLLEVVKSRSYVNNEILASVRKIAGEKPDASDNEKNDRQEALKQIERARNNMEKAREAREDKKPDKANHFNELALKEFSKAIDVLSEREVFEEGLNADLAECFLDAGKPEEALRYSKAAVDLDPMNTSALQLLARNYHVLGEYERAETYWRSSLDFAPADWDSLKGIADTYWDRGILLRGKERWRVFKRVVEIFDNALNTSDDSENVGFIHFWLGRFHADLKNYDEATYHFNVCKLMEYKPMETRVQMGFNYAESKAYDEAEDSYQDAIDLVKTSGKHGKALHETFDSSEEFPTNDLLAVAKIELATILAIRQSRLDKALQLVDEAASLTEKASKETENEYYLTASRHECLGLIYLAEGEDKVTRAIDEFRKAIERRAIGAGAFDDGGVYYHLARAYVTKAKQDTTESTKLLTLAKDNCTYARNASVRAVYEAEIAALLQKIDVLEPSLPAAQAAPSTPIGAQQAALEPPHPDEPQNPAGDQTVELGPLQHP